MKSRRPAQTTDSSSAPSAAQEATGTMELPYKAEMEASFGEDFSDVAVSIGPTPGANAMAKGQSIVFPDANPSKETVAHELTHIVQARNGGGGGDEGPPMAESKVSDPEGAPEQEAADVASRVASGGAAGAVKETPEPGAVHREPVTLAGLGLMTLGEVGFGGALAATRPRLLTRHSRRAAWSPLAKPRRCCQKPRRPSLRTLRKPPLARLNRSKLTPHRPRLRQL